MNHRNTADYAEMFAVLDAIVTSGLSQTELYQAIGHAVSDRAEKGAALAAAEYLQAAYPDVAGFSPKNLRRMRDFYRSYADEPEILRQAAEIGWTQNVLIIEGELSGPEKAWYIRAVQQFGWSKAELARQISSSAHLKITLDLTEGICYTIENHIQPEELCDDKDTVCVPGEHLPQSYGGVCDEGLSAEGRSVGAIPDRVSRNACCWRCCIPASKKEAGRTWDQLQRQVLPSAERGRLRQLRPPDRDGQYESRDDAAHLWRRPGGQDPPAAGLYRPSEGYRRPVVHSRFWNRLAGYRGGLSRIAGTA